MTDRPATLADVAPLMRDEDTKRAYLTANAGRPGMTPALLHVLAGKGLAEVQAIVGALPPAAAAPAALDVEPTPEEAHDIDKMRRSFGLSLEAVTASRQAIAAGEAGVLSVARLQQLKAAGREEAAAKVAHAR